MPANLTPDYQRAEQKFREAQTPEEKLAGLEEMLSTLPKHKGTEKMQADLKRRIARMRAEDASAHKTKHFDPYHFERSGAGQVVLIGMPNAGKSTLVEALTKAPVIVAPYPFSTVIPVPGMAVYEDIHIELIDMPPYTPHGFPPGMVGAIRNADIVCVVVDAAAADNLEEVDLAIKLLAERQIIPSTSPPIQAPAANHTAEIVWEKPVLILLTKIDLVDKAEDVLDTVKELFPHLEFMAVSGATGENLNALTERLFKLLNVVRVYAKPPGQKPDMANPFILKAGSTVLDLAAKIHRDLIDHFKFARVWGHTTFPGQQVPKEHVLADKDIIEVHV